LQYAAGDRFNNQRYTPAVRVTDLAPLAYVPSSKPSKETADYHYATPLRHEHVRAGQAGPFSRAPAQLTRASPAQQRISAS
jgi:hypothetical protein